MIYDGSNDYVNIGASNLGFLATNAWSGFAWIKTSSNSENGIITNWAIGVTPGWQFGMSYPVAGKLFLYIANTSGASARSQRGSTTVSDGAWHHVGWTYNGANSSGGIKLYVDGKPETLVNVVDTDPGVLVDSALNIGIRGGSSDPFAGIIEDVRLYRGVVSDSVIATMYAPSTRWQLNYQLSRAKWFLGTAGVAFDAASNSTYQTAQSSYSWSHTCTGANRFLAVDIELLSVPGTTVSSITYNGVALAFIGAKSTVSGAGRVECWGLAAPASGSNTIAVTLSAAVGSAGTAVSYTGVHQTVPTEAFNSAQATNVGAADATVTVTSVADNCVIHAACATDDTSITAGNTARNNVTGALGSGADEDTGPITPATATAMSYTGVGALQTWAIAGYAIRPTTAAGGNTYSPSIAESGSGTDAPSDSVTFASSISESGSGTSSETSVVVLSGGVAEAGSATDSPTNAATFLSSTAESGATVDAPTAVVVLITSRSESGAALDAVTDTAVMASSTSESGTAVDAQAAVVTFVSANIESVASLDSGTSVMIFGSGVIESISTTDAPSGSMMLGNSVSEIGGAADLSSASVIFPAGVLDALTANEAYLCSAVFNGGNSETCNAADLQGTAMVVSSGVSESVTLLDAMSSSVVFVRPVGGRVAVSFVYCPGPQIGDVYVAGPQVADAHVPGAQKVEVLT